MKKITDFFCLAGVLQLVLVTSVYAHNEHGRFTNSHISVEQSPAQDIAIEDNVIYAGGEGGEVPTPFEFNQRFELADGGVYLLLGKVILLPSLEDDSGQIHAYFKVNLGSAPWLKNTARLKSPFYLLEGPIHNWTNWDKLEVKMLCRAHGQIIFGNNGLLQYVISLELM